MKIIPRELISHLEWVPEQKQPDSESHDAAERANVNIGNPNSKIVDIMRTKIAISIICVLLAVAHLLWPNVKIDLVTLVLLLVAILPWLAAVIRSVELPGGFKIELQDVKAATEKVTARQPASATAGQLSTRAQGEGLDFLREVAIGDPNLALVGLRIEIERRLSHLAQQMQLPTDRRSAGVLLRDLVVRERVDRQTAAGLGDLIALGNQAAHGAEVSPNAAAWALDMGPLILETLDSLIAGKSNVQADG